MAQSDVCPIGDQEVVGLIPAGSGNVLLLRLIMKSFLLSFYPFYRFNKLSVTVKSMHKVLVNCLED